MGEHRQLYSYCRVTYWKENSASYPDEDWTVCAVAPLGMFTSGQQTFPNSCEGIYARDQFLSFLENVYEIGRSHAKREIREILGVKEPRT